VAGWAAEPGVVRLPGGALVRGRRLGEATTPADFTLVLADGPVPPWSHRRVRWRDFWVPADTADALDALREARRRALAGERVEVACRGGVGRTGTALAALAVLDGLEPEDAVRWVRANYHRKAVETPWQRWWLQRVR
jgi:protein-tyrosine phosphatase